VVKYECRLFKIFNCIFVVFLFISMFLTAMPQPVYLVFTSYSTANHSTSMVMIMSSKFRNSIKQLVYQASLVLIFHHQLVHFGFSVMFSLVPGILNSISRIIVLVSLNQSHQKIRQSKVQRNVHHFVDFSLKSQLCFFKND